MCSGAGYTVNINEVGGVYSGILFGISNCIGTIPGLIAPYIVGVITSKVIEIIDNLFKNSYVYKLFCDYL